MSRKSPSESRPPVLVPSVGEALRWALIKTTPSQGMTKAKTKAPQKTASTRYSHPTWDKRARRYMATAVVRTPAPFAVINGPAGP